MFRKVCRIGIALSSRVHETRVGVSDGPFTVSRIELHDRVERETTKHLCPYLVGLERGIRRLEDAHAPQNGDFHRQMQTPVCTSQRGRWRSDR